MKRRSQLEPETPPLSPLPPGRAPLSRRWQVAAILLACAYIGFSNAHLLITPVAPDSGTNYINAPDEAAHLAYVRVLGQGHLPTSADRGTTYEWHQPPLYYLLVRPASALSPHVVRLVSTLIGLAGLGVIFVAARKVFAGDPPLAVLAMGFAALLPMRQATTAAAGNDGLIELLFSLTLLLLACALLRGFTLRRAVGVGAALGAALITKATGLLLIPVIMLSLWMFWREGETWGSIGQGAAALFIAAFALSGWWFARNVALYHEVTPMRSFVREFEGTKKASDIIGKPQMVYDPVSARRVAAPPVTRSDYLGMVGALSWQTFWAAWTPKGLAASLGIPVTLPTPFYTLCGLLTAWALAGLGWLHLRRRATFTTAQRHVIALLGATFVLVLLSFVGFVWTFFQAQGRYLYPAMLPISILFALGIGGALPARYRDLGTGLVLALLFLLDLAFVVVGIAPSYL